MTVSCGAGQLFRWPGDLLLYWLQNGQKQCIMSTTVPTKKGKGKDKGKKEKEKGRQCVHHFASGPCVGLTLSLWRQLCEDCSKVLF